MSQSRSYSRYTTEAITLLGKLIKLGRKKQKWSEFDLAKTLWKLRYSRKASLKAIGIRFAMMLG